MQPKEKLKLGEILIQQNILTPLLVERIIRISSSTHRRFGQTLEDLGLLTGKEIARALAVQYGYKVVYDIAKHNIPKEVLNLIPMEMAFENRIFPLQAKDNRLALAMADPTNDDIIDTIAKNTLMEVMPVISTTREIMKSIAKNYLGEAYDSHGNKVLVVETDFKDREILVTPLFTEGYHMLEAVDANDGLQMALLHQPRLIITAKEMPGGDGFTFFTTLQSVAETRRIPVILATRRSSVEEEALAFQRGFFDYIPMPVRDITLLTRVGRAISAGKAYVPYRRGTQNIDLEQEQEE